MPVTMYCWRCCADMPMLTEPEWARIDTHLKKANLLDEMRAYQAEHGCDIQEARRLGVGAGALKIYAEITDFAETNFNAIFHHRASLYGPPCGKCGKPLRTPQARYCATCDWSRPVPAPDPGTPAP